jgi:hypothetical protein
MDRLTTVADSENRTHRKKIMEAILLILKIEHTEKQ